MSVSHYGWWHSNPIPPDAEPRPRYAPDAWPIVRHATPELPWTSSPFMDIYGHPRTFIAAHCPQKFRPPARYATPGLTAMRPGNGAIAQPTWGWHGRPCGRPSWHRSVMGAPNCHTTPGMPRPDGTHGCDIFPPKRPYRFTRFPNGSLRFIPLFYMTGGA